MIIILIALVISLLIWGIVTYNRLVTESGSGGGDFSDIGGSDSGSGGDFID